MENSQVYSFIAERIQELSEEEYRTIYVVKGSYADLWFQCSQLKKVISKEKTTVLFPRKYNELLELYNISSETIKYYGEGEDKRILQHCLQNTNWSAGTTNDIDGIQNDTKRLVKSMHVVDYPFFWQMIFSGRLSYNDALNTIIGNTEETDPEMPELRKAQLTRKNIEVLARYAGAGKKIALLNVINFSHKDLEIGCWLEIADKLKGTHNILVNMTQKENIENNQVNEAVVEIVKNLGGEVVTFKPTELPKFGNYIDIAIGVEGGAMNLLQEFSYCKTISLGTKNNYEPLNDALRRNISKKFPDMIEYPLSVEQGYYYRKIKNWKTKNMRIWDLSNEGFRQKNLRIALNDISILM